MNAFTSTHKLLSEAGGNIKVFFLSSYLMNMRALGIGLTWYTFTLKIIRPEKLSKIVRLSVANRNLVWIQSEQLPQITCRFLLNNWVL